MASTSNPLFREKNLHKAKIAIETRRFGDSVKFMMEIIKSVVPWTELSLSERNFFYTVLMKFFEEIRQTLNDHNFRSLDSDGVQSEAAKFFSNEIKEQMIDACKEMKHFIYRWLILSSRSAEATVFYLTLNVDVSCYLVELQDDEDVQKMANAVIQAYKEAKGVAKARLSWASPARLRLALHMAEFYSEILQMPEKGIKIAKKALARANAAIGTVTEEELLNELNELMSKLREYVTLWTNDENDFRWLPEHSMSIRTNFERRGLTRLQEMFTDIMKFRQHPIWIEDVVWKNLNRAWAIPEFTKISECKPEGCSPDERDKRDEKCSE